MPENVPALVNDIAQSASATARHSYTTVFKGFSAYMSLTAANAITVRNPNIDIANKIVCWLQVDRHPREMRAAKAATAASLVKRRRIRP